MRIPVLLLSGCLLPAFFAAYAEPGLPRINFEIVTLSNRADLISGGDALVEVHVPITVPLKKVTLSLNGHDVTPAFKTDAAARTMRGVLTGLVDGENELIADSNGNGHGAAEGDARDHQPPHRRAGAAGLADDAVDLRDADTGGRIRQHARVERERADDLGRRRAMQHRDRVQAVLPHDYAGLLERAARPRARPRRHRRTTVSSHTPPAARRPISR